MKLISRAFTLTAALLVLGAASAVSADEGNANTLSQQEVEKGWILLFDGETTFGWQPRGEAKWVATGGTLTPSPGSDRGVLSTTTEFADFRLKADFWTDDVVNSGIFLRGKRSGEINQGNAYELNIYDRHPQWPTGSINEVGRAFLTPRTAGKWNSYEVVAEGDRIRVYLNGQRVLDAEDDRYARGTISLQYNGQGEVRFRNLKLQPLGLKSIFNGRDLTGWKEIPDRKSVYSVTPEGYLNVKNGNGDLQTVGTYGDFILQLDVISNGEHLNSGVFFRAEPGQFWSGYESQIRNQWVGDDRTRPVDFGTGAIYNRQRARRVIPSDREWFTKTIIAHGNHMAVWVNGIQVSDFTDTRPPNASARQGYREKAGVISLQGHDPTTDLSFRRIRVSELPAAR
jgi:hypothetical protein